MKKTWNRDRLKREYERIIKNAKKDGFIDEELSSVYLDKISKKTKSPRIYKLIRWAYILGQLRAIQDIDEGYTPITIDPFEKITPID